MESDFIRRKDALDLCGWYNIYGNHPKGYKSIHAAEAWEIASIESADVAPVIHGRWIEQEKYTFGVMYDCSICDNRILDNGHSWNYCPNCGAKMDKEEEQ